MVLSREPTLFLRPRFPAPPPTPRKSQVSKERKVDMIKDKLSVSEEEEQDVAVETAVDQLTGKRMRRPVSVVSPVSDRSLRDELSAVRFRPSPTEQLSSKLVLPMVPFTTSLFTPTPPPTTPPASKLGRITPFCFSNSAVKKHGGHTGEFKMSGGGRALNPPNR